MAKMPPEMPKLIGASSMGEEYSHPAYALISASRISGGIGKLVGSDLNHHHCIRLEITPASRQRGLSRDWWYGKKMPYLTVDLSEHQWASFLTNMNSSGVPCTLARKDGHDVPGVLEEAPYETVQRELKKTADKVLHGVSAAKGIIRDMLSGVTKVNKGSLTTLSAVLEAAEREAISNMPYQVVQHKEAMEKNVEAAKSEIEGYVTHTLVQRGLESLKGPTYGTPQIDTDKKPKETL